MNRRSLDIEGWVNFPVHLPSSGEGGMLVKLWVIDRRPFEDAYGVCTGVHVIDQCSESFMGTDTEDWPENFPEERDDWTPEAYSAEMDRLQAKRDEWLERFFTGEYHEQSIPLLASIVMGSTGWSNGEFRCKYEDLTPEGQALYASMKALYPKAELVLLTFLDT